MTNKYEEAIIELFDNKKPAYKMADFMAEAFDEHHRTILEALELAQASQWQPISTAPRDGALYLGSCGGEPFTAYYEDGAHVCQFQTERSPHRPTHWMPLPTPPKEKKR
jgi:hypothetical protein